MSSPKHRPSTSAIVFSKDKPDVLSLVNGHIKERAPAIKEMSIEELEVNISELRWEFNYSCSRLEQLKVQARKVEPLEDGESVLERVKRNQPKKRGRVKKSPREKMKALGIYTDAQLDEMGVK